MSSEKNITKDVESNSPLLASEEKGQKSSKGKRRLVKKNFYVKSTPGESSSPLSTPKSLKPKSKIGKNSSKENSKLVESSSQLKPLENKTETNVEIVNKFPNDKPMPSNSKEMKKSRNRVRRRNKKNKPVNTNESQNSQNPKPLNTKESENSDNPKPVNTKESENSQNPKPVNTKESENSQNPKPEVAKKGFHSGQVKEVASSSIMQDKNIDMKDFGGFIFMCNAKTKRDCYHYRVFGVQSHKKDFVMGIKPGMMLFLFDFDVKLLYGIYKASSGGGMKLEPAAFGGGFPLQIRFEVFKDCSPLPESVFKKAIKENYDDRTRKFKTELTFGQVKRLTNLFKPAQKLLPNPQAVVHELKPTVASQPLLLSEQEYRSYGLKGDRHQNLAPVVPLGYDPYRPGLESGPPHPNTGFFSRPSEQESMQLPNPTVASAPVLLTEKDYRSYGLRGDRPPVAYDHFKPNQERDGPHSDTAFLPRPSEQENLQLVKPTLTEQDYRSYGVRGNIPSVYNPYKTDQEKEPPRSDPLFLSEKDYRTYGLKSRQENHASMTQNMDPSGVGFYQSASYNLYDQDSDLVERYLPHPVANANPSSSYRFDSTPVDTVIPRGERLYSGNAPNVLLDYNHNVGPRGNEAEYKSAPISSRYAFDGPPVVHR